MNRAALVLLLVAACGGPAAKNAGASGASETSLGRTAMAGDTPQDGGAPAPRSCMHDFKDPRPCSEECDHGIAASCVILAARWHESVVLYERACELRDAPACATAARFHANGNGVPPNRAKQMEFLAKACALGQAESCSTPAKAFATGNGVPHDERRARELWERGCGGGIEAACEALGDAGP